MLEFVVLGVFSAALIACIALDASILHALLFGYALFFAYGLIRRKSVKELLQMSWGGVKSVKNILLTLLLVGMVTAVWRASGTIAYIIYYASKIIVPSVFPLIIFLLCALISMLTGTALGTAAIVGVISMTIANAMGISPILAGGAILSGSYLGDRCSPMSTSLLLVSELTGTDIYRNIKNLVRSAAVPFAAACLVYLALGLTKHVSDASEEIWNLFRKNFNLHFLVLLPAVLVLALCAFRVKVKLAIGASILAGCVLCLTVQKMDVATLFSALWGGFHAKDPALARVMDGGGVVSMLKVVAIVCISSCYAGIFDGTGMLAGIKRHIGRLGAKISPYGALVVTALVADMAACNQTLGILLTHQLCCDMEEDRERLAVNLADTALVIAPLVPWSVAGATPLATVGAPMVSILAACYLYLLPLWGFIRGYAKWRKAGKSGAPELVGADQGKELGGTGGAK